MSLHKSLVPRNRLRRQRNVLTRWERILQLKQEEKWADGRSVFSLPKVRVVHHKKTKKKKAAAEGEEAVEGAEGTAVAPAEKAPAAKGPVTKAPAGKAPAAKAPAAKGAAAK